nr:MAG TPA: hypothetical protein [Caudoviricetes sp.]
MVLSSLILPIYQFYSSHTSSLDSWICFTSSSLLE